MEVVSRGYARRNLPKSVGRDPHICKFPNTHKISHKKGVYSEGRGRRWSKNESGFELM